MISLELASSFAKVLGSLPHKNCITLAALNPESCKTKAQPGAGYQFCEILQVIIRHAAHIGIRADDLVITIRRHWRWKSLAQYDFRARSSYTRVLRFSFPISGNSAAFFKISDLLNPLH
jgi:hypothetical protein